MPVKCGFELEWVFVRIDRPHQNLYKRHISYTGQVMNAIAGVVSGGYLLVLLGLFALVGIIFLALTGYRQLRAQRKQHEIRHRQREQFWGYE
jgi:hypothetical protein